MKPRAAEPWEQCLEMQMRNAEVWHGVMEYCTVVNISTQIKNSAYNVVWGDMEEKKELTLTTLFVTQLCAPAHRGILTYYLLTSLNLRTIWGGDDQPHRVSPYSGGLPCTSEFFWPLRSLTIRMRSQYTPIYYRKSPVPTRELYTILLAHTRNSFCHLTICPRTPRRTHILCLFFFVIGRVLTRLD